MQLKKIYIPSLDDVKAASINLKGVASVTPLNKNFQYSKKFGANILFKREDLQVVRSYKIRGAYNKMFSLLDGITRSSILIILLLFIVPKVSTTDAGPPCQVLLKRLARRERGLPSLPPSPSGPRRATGERDLERLCEGERFLLLRPRRERRWRLCASSSEYDSDDGDRCLLPPPPLARRERRSS